ncbi:MAG: type I restriction endonuclease subunit R [Holosporales bacterium]|jgi:type I restriction enzyme R subunit|nr:type I restriction endonuclease subunit R [Holosporales bacterium]
MTELKDIVSNSNGTVMARYEPTTGGTSKYQMEAELEAEFIRILQDNGYEYLAIKEKDDLVDNLRSQLSKLNNYKFSDNEWNRLFREYINRENDSVADKTEKIQRDDTAYNLKLDNNECKNIRLVDKRNINNNSLQVINQYKTGDGARPNRYDVSILVNGLPLVHIELKRRGVAIKEAFNQISRYQRESFWADNGLFEFAQLFIISNGTNTKYYSNSTRYSKRTNSRETNSSFKFTFWWTDENNKRISDLIDFAKTFLSKHTLLNILIKYCVFTFDKRLLVMRPYQIAATEKILDRIEKTTNTPKLLGTIEAGGYIWHTTGSGKTLTSFKVAQLAAKKDYIDKVLFVVDRKDLDNQTINEYEKYQKGAVNSNKSAEVLTKQLSETDPDKKLILTTIQKLSAFISKNNKHNIFEKHVVLIFDECHRSQFGKMHVKIIKNFKKRNIFGFTGTPIFKANAIKNGNPLIKTTKHAFGEKLHAYTIVDAIKDENVLPFRVEWINTVKGIKENMKDEKIRGINTKKALHSPEKIRMIVEYILEHFNRKTKRNEYYTLEERWLKGFNSIFAVDSIDAAKLYYNEFQKQMKKAPETDRLKIALIYSFGTNDPEQEEGLLPDEDFDTSSLDKDSQDFLDNAIKDYNKTFGVSYDTSAQKFENYYKDLSERVKHRELDLLLVVNMFLTGFDAPTLNTLWVDKNLKQHGLLQAFSRTNRILNSVKSCGNIVCFRNLKEAMNEALAIFGNKEANDIVLLKSYDDYYNGWEKDNGEHQRGYKELIEELRSEFPLPVELVGNQKEEDFFRIYGKILRVKNELDYCDDFAGKEILTEMDFANYKSTYLDLYDKRRKAKDYDKEIINDDLVFELELVEQTDVGIDYILRQVAEYEKSGKKNEEIKNIIIREVNSSFVLRSKKELILNFIYKVNVVTGETWHEYVRRSYSIDLEKIIKEENLSPEQMRKFMERSFNNNELNLKGTAFSGILPQTIQTTRFDGSGLYDKKKGEIGKKLYVLYEKYSGILEN